MLLLLIFLAHTLGVLVALWVYDDARKRYLRPIWAVGWAVVHYPAWLVAFYFYRVYRPPVIDENALQLSAGKKFLVYIASFPLFVIVAVVIAIVLALSA